MSTSLFLNRLSIHRGLVVATLLVCLVMGPVGCRRKPAPKNPSKNGTSSSIDDNAQQLLVNVVGLLTHDVDASTYEAAVDQLNKFVNRRPGAIKELDDTRRQLITQVLGAGVLPNASRKDFSNEDIEFLRNAFFIRTVARTLTDSTLKPIEQAAKLFDWAVRETSLVPSDWYRSAPPLKYCFAGLEIIEKERGSPSNCYARAICWGALWPRLQRKTQRTGPLACRRHP